METIKLDSLSVIQNIEQFVHVYGLRSYTLWLLQKYSEQLGYKIPTTLLLSSDLSVEMLKHFNYTDIIFNKAQSYLKPDSTIIQNYYEYLFNNKKELLDIASSIDDGISPIIRGASCAEGYNDLSFAGVCHSSIPKKDLSFEENIFTGTAKVLSSIYSPYAKYYFNSHNIPENGKNISIIMMKMLNNPVFHVTAYVYPSEIRIRYFFTPTTGTVYRGGGDLILNPESDKSSLKVEFGKYEEIWKHTLDVLFKLSHLVYGDSFPIDVEFLITENNKEFNLNIVQIRQLSNVHFKNFEMSKSSLSIKLNPLQDILVKKTNLYHSVIDCCGQINLSEKFQNELTNEYLQIFIVKHQLGEGLFYFMDSLPKDKINKIGLIVTHPNERSHDHFQYSVYEDRRVRFVFHVNEELTSELENGMIVHVISSGNEVVIKKMDKLLIDNIEIEFVDENSLPDTSTVSAVFLVGFVDGNIIAARNERGWDIPGGHVDPGDFDLIEALKREADEEAGVTVGNVNPFAVLKFKGKDKVMLFYVSKDCKLGEFIVKEDAFERQLMNISEFISKYNWRKDVIELLIKRALKVISH